METIVEDSRIRELDFRNGDGIEVRLLWEPCTDRVFVAVADERTSDCFRIPVATLPRVPKVVSARWFPGARRSCAG